jgi:hypothetical protein
MTEEGKRRGAVCEKFENCSETGSGDFRGARPSEERLAAV